MRLFSSPLLVAAALFFASSPQAEAKKKPFTYTRKLAAETEVPKSSSNTITADGIPLMDDTHIDEGYSILKAALNGDKLSVFKELTNFADLESLWKVPEYTKALVENVPVLQGFQVCVCVCIYMCVSVSDEGERERERERERKGVEREEGCAFTWLFTYIYAPYIHICIHTCIHTPTHTKHTHNR
jgi:hypothetical protein